MTLAPARSPDLPRVVELVRSLDAARALAEEWEELADAAAAGPLCRPTYALAWWEHLGLGRLLVTTVREQGRLVALAPLYEWRLGPVSVARWLGHGLGTVTQPLVRPGHDAAARALWTTLATRTRLLDLVECRADASGLDALVDLGLSGRRTTVRRRDVCPTADLEGDGLAVLRRPEARHLRRNLARADRRVAEAGWEFRVEVATDPAGLDRLLPEIRAVFDAAEAANPRLHLLRPPYEAFTLAYLTDSLERGRAAVFVGRLDRRAAAFRFALVDADTVSLTTTRFRPEHTDLSPGHLLMREVYRWAAAQGLRHVDQLLGSSQTKRQWTTGGYETLEVRSGIPAVFALVEAAARTAQLARQSAAAVRRRPGPTR